MLGSYSRADRLATLIALFGSRYVTADEALWFMDRDEFNAVGDVTDDDQELANACLDIEQELQEREWEAAERLLAAGVFGPESAERLAELPPRQRGRAAQDLLDLCLVI